MTDSSVTNYCMYGYVSCQPLVYAGQYADKIIGESINMNSKSWTGVTLIPDLLDLMDLDELDVRLL